MSGINVVEASEQAKSRVNGYLDLALTVENVGKVVEDWADCAGGDAGQGKLHGESLMNYVPGTLELQRGETRFRGARGILIVLVAQWYLRLSNF